MKCIIVAFAFPILLFLGALSFDSLPFGAGKKKFHFAAWTKQPLKHMMRRRRLEDGNFEQQALLREVGALAEKVAKFAAFVEVVRCCCSDSFERNLTEDSGLYSSFW